MKKLIIAFLLSLIIQVSYATNANVQSRPLPEEVIQKIKNRSIEEDVLSQNHKYYKTARSNVSVDQYPPIFFPYSCHSVTAVSALGDFFSLEDGSVWSVNPSYSKEVLIWKSTDPLLIYPTRAWFSSYKYTIFNQSLNSSVEVTLTQGPLIDGQNSLRVVGVDKIKGELYLNDNSRWTICSSDMYLLEYWQEGDYIIVGSNNSWFCSHKNVLINSNLYSHIRAQQF
jgi:hypothetical protein